MRFSVNDPAPANEKPPMPLSELVVSAPLTPTAHDVMLPPLSASTVTAAAGASIVAWSIFARISASIQFIAPAAPAETAADVDAGMATWPATASTVTASIAFTSIALDAFTEDF